MSRRLFVRLGIAGFAAGLVGPRVALAGGAAFDPFKTPLAGSLYYTAADPGRWKGKEGGHVPQIERSGGMIQVTTPHEMNGFVHYIVKHMILDEKLRFVRETVFDPENDSPISEHDIGGLGEIVYAVSVCNKHDAWLNALSV